MFTLLQTEKRKFEPAGRISPFEALSLFKNADLSELGRCAQKIRFQKNPDPIVTYVIDTNPNYTNICNINCSFCAFHRKFDDKDAYTLTIEEVLKKVDVASKNGATTVLLQGGCNPNLSLDYYLTIVQETKKRFPNITPHFFSAPEIQMMSEISELSIREVLEKLKYAGQTTLPGGGAEILSKRTRDKISPKKGGPEKWLEVHKTAHEIGMKSTATMMIDHLEEPEDIVEHLEKIRQLQDETEGFTAFIPWTFKPNNTKLQNKIDHPVNVNSYLRIIAFSRIFLDNFSHIQASWFSEGKKAGQEALHFGADDFGGTIFEENVHRASNHINQTTVEEVELLIKEAGFKPVQRDTLYNILNS